MQIQEKLDWRVYLQPKQILSERVIRPRSTSTDPDIHLTTRASFKQTNTRWSRASVWSSMFIYTTELIVYTKVHLFSESVDSDLNDLFTSGKKLKMYGMWCITLTGDSGCESVQQASSVWLRLQHVCGGRTFLLSDEVIQQRLDQTTRQRQTTDKERISNPTRFNQLLCCVTVH